MLLEKIINLITLFVMEVALGIDNIIFVSILASKLPVSQQPKARRVWMFAGIVMRISLLAILMVSLQHLKSEIIKFPLFGGLLIQLSGKDLILVGGGMFLIFKSVKEIHEKLEGEEVTESSSLKNSFQAVALQIILVDLIFSIDSIITAIGITNTEDISNLVIMAAAVVLAMFGMFWFAKPLGDLVQKHPTLKMLALCFLLLIGVLLVAEGFDAHIEKGFIYFAMGFSILVEILNIYIRKHDPEPVHLKMPTIRDEETPETAETWKD